MNKSKIKIKQEISELLKYVEQQSKPTHCLLCGKKCSSFCNSHVVPQFILKEIAESGMVYYGQSLHKEIDYLPTKTGIKNAFTFRLICRECDKKQFANYETPDMITNFDDLSYEIKKLILLEIAAKTHLSHINTKLNIHNLQVAVNPEIFSAMDVLKLPTAYQIDIEEHFDYLHSLIKFRKSTNFPFEVLYSKLLDYQTSITTQTIISYIYDINGKQIYNPYDFSNSIITRYFYIVIFPFKGKTRILYFIEKKNKYLVQCIIDQFNSLNDEEKLHFLFMSLIIYDEQFYISPKLHEEIMQDRKLTKLYRNIEDFSKNNWHNCKEIMNFRHYNNYLLNKYSF